MLLFDVDVTVGLERIKTRNSIDRIEQEKIEFFNRVKEVYLKLARETPEKYFIVDANKDLISIKQHIIEILNKNLYANKLFEQT